MGDTHSSKKILTTIVGIFIVLMGSTALVVAQRVPQQFTVRFSRPGATTAWAKPVSYQGQEGKSALELLKSHVRITTQQSSYGEYVNTINGVQSGTDGKYWALYVNGKQTPIAAGNYITQAGDTVEWKFE
jgi:hypothetical protein